jgi:hypothetical protein
LHLSHALLTLDLSFVSLLLFAGGLAISLDAPSGVLDTSTVAPEEGLPMTWTQSGDARGRDAPLEPLSIVLGELEKRNEQLPPGEAMENYPVVSGPGSDGIVTDTADWLISVPSSAHH